MFCFYFYLFSFIKPAWNVKLTESDKKLFLDEHNKYRRMVQPTATNMQEMIWDPELAKFAEEHSRKCQFSHSSGGSTSKFSSLGENLYITSQLGISNEKVGVPGIKAWYDEYVDYDYNSNSCNQGKVCGHYTQVVWANSYAVGCGITQCDNMGSILVCNYGPPGNYIGQNPYKSGTTCSQCGTTCVNKLCQDGSSESDSPQIASTSTSSIYLSQTSTEYGKLTESDKKLFRDKHNKYRRMVQPGNYIGQKPHKSGTTCLQCEEGTTCVNKLCQDRSRKSDSPQIASTSTSSIHLSQTCPKYGKLTESDKKLFLYEHNKYRGMVQPGNYIGQKPYKSGTTCSQCEEGTTCVNKLCQDGSSESDSPQIVSTSTSSIYLSQTSTEYGKLTESDKKLFLDEHNKYRRMVQPTATNMQEMIWDPELAKFAEEHSRKCQFSHSSGGSTSKFSFLGENLYMTSQLGISNEKVGVPGIKAWYDEYVDYDYDTNSCNQGKVCGHYTQVVWANSYAVGCGITQCDNMGSILVCNYGPPGNYIGQNPYKSGTTCSQCEEGTTCVNKLCQDGSSESDSPQIASTSTSSIYLSQTSTEYGKLTESDKKLFLDEHNKYRRMVQPTATNMQEMIWDPELAKFAEEHSRKCQFLHSSGGSTSKFSFLGENLYMTSQLGISNEKVGVPGIKAWYDEYVDYDYNSNSCNQGKVCGHYTQVVWANSYAVGCGITQCDNMGSILVCNYGPPGNYIGQNPYKSGTTCSQCEEGTTCVNKLCQDGSNESDSPQIASTSTSSIYLSQTSTEYGKLTESDKKLFLDEHNKYRRMVQPTATNMQEMIWDPELAKFAEEHSRKCQFLHSSGKSTSKFSFLGENLYITSQLGISNEKVGVPGIKAWYDEYVDYDYNSNSCNQGKVCGHYTQVVWANSYAVGCGITQCDNMGSILVCNYGPPGNYIGQKPYKSGTTCSQCGTTCVNKLCQDEAKKLNLSCTPDDLPNVSKVSKASLKKSSVNFVIFLDIMVIIGSHLC